MGFLTTTLAAAAAAAKCDLEMKKLEENFFVVATHASSG